MDSKDKKNKPMASLIIKTLRAQEQIEVGFDNGEEKANAFKMSDNAKQELIRQFLKNNQQSTPFMHNSANNYIKNEIYISLSVDNIYKLISKQELINYKKVILINGYCILTSLILQVLFFIVIAYLRPALMTNVYNCFDQHSLSYINCHTRNMCSCDKSQGCVSFCYNDSYTNCTAKFKNENLDSINNLISLFNQTVFVKYKLKPYENKSFFQKINKNYCDAKFYIFLFAFVFFLGGVIGFCVFGPIADVNGKKIAIEMLLIGLIIVIIPIFILNHFDMNDNVISYVIYWSFIYFFLGGVLLPLDSCLYLYVLENYPLSDELKSLNVNYLRREAFSFGLYYIYDYFIKNIAYALYFIEGYLIIFALVFILYYIETPRFYSERRKQYQSKAKAIRFYTKPWNVLYNITDKTKKTFEGFKRIALINKVSPLDHNTTNKNELNPNNNIKEKNVFSFENKNNSSKTVLDLSKTAYEIIIKKYYYNKHITKYYYLMLFCFIGISVCYYSIILSLIKNLMNPNVLLAETQKVFVCIYMLVFILIIIPLLNKIIMECFSFEGLIPYLLIIFTIMTCVFEIPELNSDFERINYYGNDIDKRSQMKNIYIEGTSFWIITWIYHIYEFLLLRQAPTLYRTIFFFKQKSVCQFSIFLSIVSVYLLDTPVLIVGILGIVLTLLFFVVRINWKYEMFEENKDIEDKQKMNNQNEKSE